MWRDSGRRNKEKPNLFYLEPIRNSSQEKYIKRTGTLRAWPGERPTAKCCPADYPGTTRHQRDVIFAGPTQGSWIEASLANAGSIFQTGFFSKIWHSAKKMGQPSEINQ